MMDNQLMRRVLVACGVALLFAGVAVAQGPMATATVGATQIDWAPSGSFGLQLTVSGPNGFYMQQTFGAGQAASFSLFDQGGQTLPAGSYTYELRAVPQLDKAQRDELAAAREAGAAPGTLRKAGKLPAVHEPMSGAFAIRDGAIVMGGAEEAGPASKPSGNQISTKDQVIADDLIVDGSACIGMDCVNNENFGFDTLRLKENNTRIKFDDTSNSGSFPNNDWQLTANDSANGGANKFSVDDITNGKTPFTIEANTPSNTLYVDSTGRVGIGTTSPVVQIHTVDGNTPALRLEQDGSAGFTAQTWDVAGNETNFFVRDATHSSKIPFKIIPNAPTNSLYINASGNVGLGTSSPDANLHVFSSSAITTDGQLHVENTNGTAADRNLVRIENNGPPTMFFSNTNTTSGNWTFTVNNSSQFQLNNATAAGLQMTLSTVGDMTISGSLTEGSSRAIKTGFETLDPKQVLDRVSALPVTSWSYRADETGTRHIGPMAEDFYAAFGVGVDNKHIAPSDKAGVALLAIQGLNKELQQKDAQIEKVQKQTAELLEQKDRQIEDLNARLAALEALVQQH